MGTETPNFDLYKPDNGEDGWSAEVNDNFNIIDNHLSSGTTVTASGDGSTTTFTLDHELGQVPSAAHVQPASEDASTDFWIYNKTDTTVSIRYAAPPPSGSDNLEYEVITHV